MKRISADRVMTAFLCLGMVVCPAGEARAGDKVPDETVAVVDSYADGQVMENEAEMLAVQEEGYRKLRAEERRARIEMLRLELEKKKKKRFTQTLKYRNGYESNYFLERHPSEKQTILYWIIPSTTLDLSGDKVKLKLNYTPEFEVPARFNRHNAVQKRQRFSPRFELPVGKKTFLRSKYSFFRGQNRASSEVSNITLRTENNVSSEVEHYLNRKFSMAIEHTYSNTMFSASTMRKDSSSDHWFLPRVNYYLTPKTAVFFQTGLGLSKGGNFHSYNSKNFRMTVGVKGDLTRKSTAFINVGYMYKNLQEHPTPWVNNFSGIFLENVYLYRPGPKTVIQIIAGSDAQNSYTSGVSYFAPASFSLGVTQKLLKRLTASTRLGVRQNKYKPYPVEGEGVISRNDRYLNLELGLRYDLRRYISVGCRYLYGYRSSTLPNYGFIGTHAVFLEVDITV